MGRQAVGRALGVGNSRSAETAQIRIWTGLMIIDKSLIPPDDDNHHNHLIITSSGRGSSGGSKRRQGGTLGVAPSLLSSISSPLPLLSLTSHLYILYPPSSLPFPLPFPCPLTSSRVRFVACLLACFLCL